MLRPVKELSLKFQIKRRQTIENNFFSDFNKSINTPFSFQDFPLILVHQELDVHFSEEFLGGWRKYTFQPVMLPVFSLQNLMLKVKFELKPFVNKFSEEYQEG